MELEKRAIKIERFERDHAKELKELVSHRAQKRDEKWQRWKRDQKEEERRLKDEHEKLIKHYEEKKERLMAVVAKRDEGIKRMAEVVNKRIEDIQMKREMQEMHESFFKDMSKAKLSSVNPAYQELQDVHRKH